jgi:hypothetical protein
MTLARRAATKRLAAIDHVLEVDRYSVVGMGGARDRPKRSERVDRAAQSILSRAFEPKQHWHASVLRALAC